MSESIFRFTNSADVIGSLADTEIIEFNLFKTSKPDEFSRLTAPSFRLSRDVNFHPNPRKVGDPIQDSLAGVLDVEIAGYFVNHLESLGPTNLANWQVGEAKTPDFPFGRFGIVLESFDGLLTFSPTVNAGYILYDIDVQDVEDPKDEVPFIARFYFNGDYSELFS